MPRWTVTGAALVVLLAACGEPVTPSEGSDAEPSPAETVHTDAIWFDVLAVSDHGDPDDRIALVQTAEELRTAWERRRFDGDPAAVDFAEHIVLVLTRNEDACPDDLVEARLTDGVLETTWLPPPGPCNEPLIQTAFAVALHRGDLPESFRVVLREGDHYGGDKERLVELPPYDGPPAPAPSPPPRQTSDAELDAVFAGHSLRRCDQMPDFRTPPRIDGPLSEDPEVAEIQRRRAEFALPSDEATARRLRDDPQANTAFGFPMTEAEFNELMSRNRPEFSTELNERYLVDHADTYAFTMIDQAAGGMVVVAFTGDVDGHRRRLAELFPDVPMRVAEAPATQAELQEAQKRLHERFPHGQRPRIQGSGGGGPYLEISVLDPSREDLDALAAAVDPAWACVDPVLSGLPRD